MTGNLHVLNTFIYQSPKTYKVGFITILSMDIVKLGYIIFLFFLKVTFLANWDLKPHLSEYKTCALDSRSHGTNRIPAG